ncbi:hypothetical protein AAVH_26455, partial [Aphelenchoides avenae]
MITNIVTVHRYASTAINTFSLAFNAVLMWLAVRHSHFEKKQFKSVFMLTCTGGFLLSVVLLFSQP